MAKRKAKDACFTCARCFSEARKYTDTCPACGSLFSLKSGKSTTVVVSEILDKDGTTVVAREVHKEEPEENLDTTVSLDEVPDIDFEFVETSLEGVNDVLGGGIYSACSIIVCAEPGCGKSTWALQVAGDFCAERKRVLYCLAEEAPEIVKKRVKRLALRLPGKYFRFSVGDSWDEAEANIAVFKPHLVICDSADRYKKEGIKGKLAHKEAVIRSVIADTHERCCSSIIISHMNGDGEMRGEKSNEHDPDVSLWLINEGSLIAVKAEKNRFGSKVHRRYLEMTDKGLLDVEHGTVSDSPTMQ